MLLNVAKCQGSSFYRFWVIKGKPTEGVKLTPTPRLGLKKRFFNTSKFSNHDSNKFGVFLQKSVHPYEYMDDWEKFNETSLPEKEDFYRHLNMEDITNADYVHAKSVCKDFKLKNLENIMICMFKVIHYC